jgi:hypothetical protein
MNEIFSHPQPRMLHGIFADDPIYPELEYRETDQPKDKKIIKRRYGLHTTHKERVRRQRLGNAENE